MKKHILGILLGTATLLTTGVEAAASSKSQEKRMMKAEKVMSAQGAKAIAMAVEKEYNRCLSHRFSNSEKAAHVKHSACAQALFTALNKADVPAAAASVGKVKKDTVGLVDPKGLALAIIYSAIHDSASVGGDVKAQMKSALAKIGTVLKTRKEAWWGGVGTSYFNSETGKFLTASEVAQVRKKPPVWYAGAHQEIERVANKIKADVAQEHVSNTSPEMIRVRQELAAAKALQAEMESVFSGWSAAQGNWTDSIESHVEPAHGGHPSPHPAPRR